MFESDELCEALNFYSWLLNLSDEIEYLWSRVEKSTCHTFTFVLLLNRYVILLGFFPILVLSFTGLDYHPSQLATSFMFKNSLRANTYVWVLFIIAVTNQSVTIGSMVMIAYSVYGNSQRILLSTTLVGLSALGLTLYTFIVNVGKTLSTDPKDFGMLAFSALNTSHNSRFAGIPSSAFDVLVLTLTFVKVTQVSRRRRFLEIQQKSLAQVLLRDGSRMLLMLLVMNAANLLLLMGVVKMGPLHVHLSVPVIGATSTPVISLSTTLLSHVIISLRKEAKHTTSGIIDVSELNLSSLRFASLADSGRIEQGTSECTTQIGSTWRPGSDESGVNCHRSSTKCM